MKKNKLLMLLLIFSQCCFAQHWDSLSGGINRAGTCLYTDTISNKLYVGGTFSQVNHQSMWGIASWSNCEWDSLAKGIDPHTTAPGSTWAIQRYGNYIYAGGNFSVAGNVASLGLARWDGNAWDSIQGGQPNGVVRGMCVYNNELYVCGTFTVIGGVSAKQIAKWNGVSWQAVGNNYSFGGGAGIISGVIFYNGNLYVAGGFTDPFGHYCCFAKWDGASWQFFTNILQGGLDGIWDMAVYNNDLYIGGLFYTSSGNAGTSIMRWNDTTWSAVGGSVQVGSLNPYPTIKDMCVHNGKLFCAGNFEKIGGLTANNIASWDGTNWCGYNTDFSAYIERICFYNDTLYSTGGFVALDNFPVNHIAKWIGGNSPDTCGVISTGIEENLGANDFSVFPNPANDLIAIQLNNLNGHNLQIKIIDVLGQTVIEKKEESASSNFEKQIDVSGLSPGVYLMRVVSGEKEYTQKFIIQR